MRNKSLLIGLSGYAGSGKDQVAKFLQELDPTIENKKFSGKLKQIAGLILGVDPEVFESQDFKSSSLSEEWFVWDKNPKVGGTDVEPIYHSDPQMRPMTVREFLQKLGTEAVRDKLHQNAWVNALLADYKPKPKYVFRDGDYWRRECIICGKAFTGAKLQPVCYPCVESQVDVYPNWVITDVRFENEAQAIKARGGVIIRIDRPGVKPINAHPSETAMDHWDFDYKIANASDLVSLKFTVENIYKELL